MDKKEIDKIFGYSPSDFYDELYSDGIEPYLKYSNEKISLKEFNELSYEKQDQIINEIVKNIMSIIENDDDLYKYFTSKKNQNFEIYAEFLQCSKKHTEDIEKAIEESGNTHLDNYMVTDLISSLEPEKIKNYLVKEEIKKLGLKKRYIVQLMEATGKLEEYLNPETINELELTLTPEEKCALIEKTGKPEEFLVPEKIKGLELSDFEVYDLIIATGKPEKYLTLEKIKELKLGGYFLNALIIATGKPEEFLVPEKIKELELSNFDVYTIIMETKKAEEYLLPEKIKELKLNDYVGRLIIATGKPEEYLVPEKIKKLELTLDEVYDIIEVTGIVGEFLLPWQNIDDISDRSGFNKNNVYYKANKSKFSGVKQDILRKLSEKNSLVYAKIDMEFLLSIEVEKIFSEEQLLRITNYPEIQGFILRNNNNLMIKSMEHLMKKDENWIISLDKIIENKGNFQQLIQNLGNINDEKITEEFLENFLSVISNSENYFDIQSYEDVANYSNKKNEICLDIFNGKKDNLPPSLQAYDENDLYKFGLLEYKFGIDLKEANRIINRYGTDSDKLPNNTVSEYIRLLKTIIDCDNIKDIIQYAIENDTLEKPWIGFPNARNVEGKILNMFEDLYNEKLYKVKTEDRLTSQESFTDENEIQHKFEVYAIKDDFNMNVRVEGAYAAFKEPEDFKKYYENPNIENHGNCESYIGNDIIAIARNRNSIIVGYDYIYNNALTSAAPYDLGTSNRQFSIYNEHSDFRIPDEMKNHTRHPHNEMVKERLIIDKDGNTVKYKPSYIVWIEEDPKQERGTTEWKENREKDTQWNMTKKAAAQLGVPIVVIDREYFAQRETDKIDLMKKMILGKEINEEKYKEYIPKYCNLSKAELIEQLIIKFENNRTGLQFNEKLNQKYFTQEQLSNIIQELGIAIEKMPYHEKKRCLEFLKNVANKEYTEGKNKEIASFYRRLSDEIHINLNTTNGEHTIYERLGISSLEENKKINTRVRSKMEIYGNLEPQVTLKDVIKEAQDIEPLFEKAKQVQLQNKSSSPVHGVQHIRNVLLLSNYLGKQSGIPEDDLKLLREAAIRHDRCHKKAGDKEHAKEGAEFYLQNEDSEFDFDKKKVIAAIIEAHESNGIEDIENIISSRLPSVTQNRKQELVLMAQILQDADRLDMLRYDIEKLNGQRFDPNRLNNKENTKLISAVIELNTRQAIETGYLKLDETVEEKKAKENLLKLYLDRGITYEGVNYTKQMIATDRNNIPKKEIIQGG